MSGLWVLIDGTNSVYRDFHAAGDAEAKLFRKRLQAIIEQWGPSRVIATFDAGKTFRHELFDGYKAGRSKPDGIDDALKAARLACLDEGVDELAVEGFEADDLIATFVDQALEADCRAVIISADKDLFQLLLDGAVTQAIAVRRKRGKLDCDWMTAERLHEKYGVPPQQWVEYRAMIGDKSDGIDGISGVGPKAAAAVLSGCPTLDEFYADPFKASVGQACRTKIFNAKNNVPRLRELLTLRRDVPLPEGW